ncbi:hypothetical protein EJ06DRAFT_149432 [Trichodelitschia bisporula]|uniref:Uncharacterized protein n=1 Tax=Trichodelitschia bisporula TaxID=703511 RepID=A0A6G1HNK8_9PEZI|nr:hypothetical protein EJ06DRAFT_149432 [Trichodelitschia bisporula]
MSLTRTITQTSALVIPNIEAVDSATTHEVNSQDSSIFFRLPAELRNIIYELVLSTPSQIVDPSPYSDASRPSSRYIPHLSTALLRTCRRIHSEHPIDVLYGNTFSFTLAKHAHLFFKHRPAAAALIRDVELDLRELDNMTYTCYATAPSWESYICKNVPSFASALYWPFAKEGLEVPTRLTTDVPGLRVLRINLLAWRFPSPSTGNVSVVKRILEGVSGLETVVVWGGDGSRLLMGKKEEYLKKWGPVILTGVMEITKLAGLLTWMAGCIEGEPDDMMVCWGTEGPSASLKVVSGRAFRRDFRRAQNNEAGERGGLTRSGWSTLTEYQQRWPDGEFPYM